MRDLLAREDTDPAAADAVALFCYSVRKAIGALAATLDGLDTLVFAGGIGENAPVVRARVCAGLVAPRDRHRSRSQRRDSQRHLDRTAAPATVRVVRTDEEAIIARETTRLLGG